METGLVMGRTRSHPTGFTLVELLITVVIIGILAGLSITGYGQYIRRANRADATAALLRISTAQERFYLQNGRYAGPEELAEAAGRKFLQGPSNPFLEGNQGMVNHFFQNLPGMTSRTQVLPTAEVRAAADLVTKLPGGHGAVREAIEAILKSKRRWEDLIQKYVS